MTVAVAEGDVDPGTGAVVVTVEEEEVVALRGRFGGRRGWDGRRGRMYCVFFFNFLTLVNIICVVGYERERKRKRERLTGVVAGYPRGSST